MNIRFLTEELGFESDSDCIEFLCEHNAQDLLKEADEDVRLLTGQAGLLFKSLHGAAFSKVDIKGQI